MRRVRKVEVGQTFLTARQKVEKSRNHPRFSPNIAGFHHRIRLFAGPSFLSVRIRECWAFLPRRADSNGSEGHECPPLTVRTDRNVCPTFLSKTAALRSYTRSHEGREEMPARIASIAEAGVLPGGNSGQIKRIADDRGKVFI